jgi:hypothetical protein
MKRSKTFNVGTCVNELSEIIIEIRESCSPLLLRAAGENVRKSNFLQTKAFKSKTEISFTDLLDIPKEEAFMALYLYSKCALFAGKSEHSILCVCAILFALVDHLLERNRGWLTIFLYIFPHNPSSKWKCS